ncbi:MAG: hypothetical protein WAV84_09800 [Bacteroidota bacterium]
MLLKGIDYVTILQADRRILTSSDMGMRWDTIPFPMPPAINGIETRDLRLLAMGDGSSGRLRLDSKLVLYDDTVGYSQSERLTLDYNPVGRSWDKLESPSNELRFLDYPRDGWFEESDCWMGRGISLVPATRLIDTTASLDVRDQSGYSKRCIRLGWMELDHGSISPCPSRLTTTR